jgi:hypothetical protein
MSVYHVQFWSGHDQIIDYEDDTYESVEEARQHIEELIRAMMEDRWREDWTECRFTVATWSGTTVLDIPVVAAMSALVRRTHH